MMERPKGSPPWPIGEATPSSLPGNQQFQPRQPTLSDPSDQPFAALSGLPQTRMMTAFTSALDEIEGDAAKAELCLWVAERGLLGGAYTQGLVVAAQSAYRMADKLAGMQG